MCSDRPLRSRFSAALVEEAASFIAPAKAGNCEEDTDQSSESSHQGPQLDPAEVASDVDMMLWSMGLYDIRRYWRHRFWEAETQDAAYAMRIETSPRLENVAEHSWHVADTILLLAGHFPELRRDHCVRLAILHDKMELIIGDANPVGRNGNGTKTHAFNETKRLRKEERESLAIQEYVSRLRPSLRPVQEGDLFEVLHGETPEARFVKAVDKLQALAFVMTKKGGSFEDKHLAFTLRYSAKAISYFQGLNQHHGELRLRLLQQVARRRGVSVQSLRALVETMQLTLFSDINGG
jgi:5'-deoxynucleotidase YfbR-like HD superfamily hydrolase